MHFRHYLAASCAAISMSVALAAPAAAQETSSSLRGTVESASGPVTDATITITHVPSGTVSRTTTDGSGNFGANGLRVGGPFTVEVTSGSFDGTQVTDLYLQAGQPFRLPIKL